MATKRRKIMVTLPDILKQNELQVLIELADRPWQNGVIDMSDQDCTGFRRAVASLKRKGYLRGKMRDQPFGGFACDLSPTRKGQDVLSQIPTDGPGFRISIDGHRWNGSHWVPTAQIAKAA